LSSTVQSEAPLGVFVSSVIRPEINVARDVCYGVLSRGLFRAWVWEHTPPSPEEPQEAYLAGVENADLVIWLVAAETSAAVRAEIDHAIARSKPLLVFRLPAESRDAVTQALFKRVRDGAKTADVVDLVDLESQLTQALNDVLIRAFRGRPNLERKAAVQALYGQLRGLAVARWLGAGVPLERATELFDDEVTGRLPSELRPSPASPLRVLVGDIGSGKTLAAIRFLVDAGRDAIANPEAPLPVWLSRETAIDDLRLALSERTRGMGDPERAGVVLVVDGLDERVGESPHALLEKVRAVIHSHPASVGLITTRPGTLPREDIPEAADAPMMSSAETAALISRVFGGQLQPFIIEGWAEPVRDAVRRPLFALLMGKLRTESPLVRITAVGQLIERLVAAGLGPQADALAANDLLMRLARDSIDAGGRPVPKRDLGDRKVVDEAIRSRLLAPSGDGLGFALPVLREWFGAQSIQCGVTPIGHIVDGEQRLERWRYALYVAAGTLPRSTVNEILEAVSRASPGFASEVIEEAGAHWRGQEDVAAPEGLALGRWYLQAVTALSGGMGSVGHAIFPWSGRARLPTLGVARANRAFMYGWRREEPASGAADVIEVPFATIQNVGHEFLRVHWGSASADPVWPWLQARNDLRGALTDALDRCAFLVDPMWREAAWLAASWLVRRGSVLSTPIKADAASEALSSLGPIDAISVRKRLVPLAPLRQALEGAAEILCPYPDRDRPLSGWVSSGFSDGVLLARTRQVYTAAIEIYVALVDSWFEGLSGRLPLAQLLPARLVGTLHPGTPETWEPSLTYLWEPLGQGSEPAVEIEIGESRRDAWGELEALDERIRTMRPDISWLHGSVVSTVLQVFGQDPATRLAMGWLRDELRALKWVS
jgi:hypothetical protein